MTTETPWIRWIKPWSIDDDWQLALRRERDWLLLVEQVTVETPIAIGGEAFPPDHPKSKADCDLARVLDLVAAYIAPSQPISYGKFVELLERVPGCDGWSYSDLYPRLFNVRADLPMRDPEVITFDCEVAAAALRIELGLRAHVPQIFTDLLARFSDDQRNQLHDLLGPKAFSALTTAAESKTDDEARAALAELADELQLAQGPSARVTAAIQLCGAAGINFIEILALFRDVQIGSDNHVH